MSQSEYEIRIDEMLTAACEPLRCQQCKKIIPDEAPCKNICQECIDEMINNDPLGTVNECP